MASTNPAQHLPPVDTRPADMRIVAGIALTVAIAHLLTNGRYGFHRDELQVLSDARHLDWGFVAYPPLTPFLERVGLGIFGLSLVGLRLFSVIAQAAAVLVTGLMAREPRRPWQLLSHLCLSSRERNFNTRHSIIYGGC